MAAVAFPRPHVARTRRLIVIGVIVSLMGWVGMSGRLKSAKVGIRHNPVTGTTGSTLSTTTTIEGT